VQALRVAQDSAKAALETNEQTKRILSSFLRASSSENTEAATDVDRRGSEAFRDAFEKGANWALGTGACALQEHARIDAPFLCWIMCSASARECEARARA